MKDFGAVTIYTQVYNTKPYLEQCVNSVLSQTYSNFEYILVDNGCTDGSSELLADFAQKDKRIRLVRFETNRQGFWRDLIDPSDGVYFALIDSDDWWEADYLERLITVAEENQLDMVCTGCVMHHMASGGKSLRRLTDQLLLTRDQFPMGLPVYHQFLRTTWGKLTRMDVFKKVSPQAIPAMPYGGDTAHSFQVLRHSHRMGVDTSVLYHYRIHSKSVSFQYDSRRFETDVYLYNDAIDFLTSFGPVSASNRQFLQAVYANAIFDTMQVIKNAKLSAPDKLREYRAIALHPLTQAVCRQRRDENACRSRDTLIQLALAAGGHLGRREDTDLRCSLQALLPRCGMAVTGENAGLFAQDAGLRDALLADDADGLIQRLLDLTGKNQYVKKYNLAGIAQALAAENPFLCQLTDAAFLRRYRAIYWMVWSGDFPRALEEMAGMLLDGKVTGGKETFLNLFISLAAAQEQAPAFLFGKLQLAKLYLQQNRLSECRAAAAELEEMGLSGKEEFASLIQELRRVSQEEKIALE